MIINVINLNIFNLIRIKNLLIKIKYIKYKGIIKCIRNIKYF